MSSSSPPRIGDPNPGVRRQMDVDAASHREYYRGRANARMGGTTWIARSTHPCSTGSLWRRYVFAGGDAVRKDGAYALTTSEKVIEDGNDGAGEELTIYEADGRAMP